MIRASVVVPTYRRPDLLARCLAHLVAQDFGEYEVIVCDDAVSDDTRRQVEAAAARSTVSVRYVPRPAGRRGPAAARNAGWRAARGNVIAFTDDDTMPGVDWLRAGYDALTDGVAACWGRTVVPLPPHPTDYERNEAGLAGAGFITANCFCRRAALEAVGGFDERFTMAWREDSDLYFTLLEHGYTVVHAPAAVVVHPVRPAPWAVCLGQQRKAQFNALLFKKHPALYRQQVQPAPPWHYYAIGLALVGTVAGLLTGRPILVGVAAAAWAGLTGWFCLKRLRGTSHSPRHVAEMVVTSAVVPLLSVYWRLRGAVRYRVPFL